MRKALHRSVAAVISGLSLALMAVSFNPSMGGDPPPSPEYTCYDSKPADCKGTCPPVTPKCEKAMAKEMCICNP